MPSPRSARRFGHVAAWIRLRLPPPSTPVVLLGSRPPPPSPPIGLLAPEPVATDPRKRVYAWEQAWSEGVLRLHWDADAPELLDAEYRLDVRRRVAPQELRAFWAEVKRLLDELGPLPLDGADPTP